MIVIWGTPIVATVEQVIRDIRLERFNDGLFKDINNTGSDLMVTCPFHKNGKEKNPSCGVLLNEKVDKNRKYEAGTVHCYTCGYTADLPQFIADVLGLASPVQGFKWLVGKYNYSAAEREPLELNLYRGQTEQVTYTSEADVERYHKQLKESVAALDYLRRRGLPTWITDEFKLGFDKADDTILFPVRDLSGKVVFYKGRSIVGKHFYNAKNIDKTSQIFGLYELLNSIFWAKLPDTKSQIWITESEIDALSLISQGKYAVAIMGSHISDMQCKRLENSPFRRFVIALDNDDAGRKGAALLKKKLIPKGFRFTNLKWSVSLKDVNDLIMHYGDSWSDYLTGY